MSSSNVLLNTINCPHRFQLFYSISSVFLLQMLSSVPSSFIDFNSHQNLTPSSLYLQISSSKFSTVLKIFKSFKSIFKCLLHYFQSISSGVSNVLNTFEHHLLYLQLPSLISSIVYTVNSSDLHNCFTFP
jgi:hypothetical protein